MHKQVLPPDDSATPGRALCPGRSIPPEAGKDLGQTAHSGMVTGMASKKVTITLDEAQLARIRALVAAGVAPSVSGFVQHAVGVSLDDVAGWGALLAEALQESGGALSDSERAWADEVLGVTQRGGRPAA
jgi:Arc/MetJ-type ribon-helix-helix transcriptional regulator